MPRWSQVILGSLVLCGIVLLGIRWILRLISSIIDLFKESFLPYFYNPDNARRSRRRRRFADYLVGELQRLSRYEEWKDYRFMDLEAEVEVEVLRGGLAFRSLLARDRGGLRREKSLLQALNRSRDRLILVEGEPGCGKSVALRHAALLLARRASHSRSLRSSIPIYVNLRELDLRHGEEVNRDLIHSFVARSLNRINDRDVAEFIHDEFDRGLQEGTWIFLFDSFDEIPELLSAIEADTVVDKYSEAIADFLHGMNRCRGILASRRFRGPARNGWPRLRVQPLSERRQRELVRKADLHPDVAQALLLGLATARSDLRPLAANPLFITLLCDHMRNGLHFPETAHAVFEAYIGRRLGRDAEMVSARFNVSSNQVRDFAERVGLIMAVDPTVGLSADRNSIIESLRRYGYLSVGNPTSLLDALEFIKLGRSETDGLIMRSFTFSHRRFQEYFATCAVLKLPSIVSPEQLLLDAMWRETAVVMLQTQDESVIMPLLITAEELIGSYRAESKAANGHTAGEATDFPWPPGSQHVLSVLQDGLGPRLTALAPDLQLTIDEFLDAAVQRGSPLDQAAALEVAGLLSAARMEDLLTRGFETGSQWLREIAYRQAARLSFISLPIAQGIRDALLELFDDRRLAQEELATRAHVARLGNQKGPAHFPTMLDALLHVRRAEFVLYTLALGLLILSAVAGPALWPRAALAATIFTIVSLTVPAWFPLITGIRHRSDMSLVAMATLRLMFLTLAYTLVAGGRTDYILFPLGPIGLVFILAAGCYPAVRLTIRLDGWSRPIWWPLILIWPVSLGPRLLTALYRRAMRNGLKWIILHSFPVITVVALTILGGGLAGYIARRYPLLFTTLTVTSGVLLIGFMLMSIVRRATAWVKDWLTVRAEKRQLMAEMDAARMWELVDALRLPPFRLRVLRSVREGQLLATTAENFDFLSSLCFDRTAVYRGLYRGKVSRTSREDLAVSPDETDELFRIRDQLRAATAIRWGLPNSA